MIKVLYLLALFPLFAFGHAQEPQRYGGSENPLNGLSLTQYAEIPIKIFNDDKDASYLILVDGDEYTKIKIQANNIKKIKVKVKINKTNTVETHTICSRTIGSVSLQTCTTAKLYWITR